jgi:phosphopantetheinyl transferase (holo-ACP synthase)
MVGNDVVDLHSRAVVAGPRHPRFDARVFAPSEHRALRESPEPNALRWSFWAAKEAAYKVAKKLDAATVWSPLRFVVSLDFAGDGTVEHAGRRIPVRIDADAERVHAVAIDRVEALPAVHARVAELPDVSADPSAAVRQLAREELAPLLGAAPDALEIARRERIPVLRLAGRDAPFDLSLSHHGRFVAYAAEPRGEGGAA